MAERESIQLNMIELFASLTDEELDSIISC